MIQCRFCFEKCKVSCLLYLLVNLQEGYSTVFALQRDLDFIAKFMFPSLSSTSLSSSSSFRLLLLQSLVARLLEPQPSTDFLSISCFYLASSLILCSATLASFLLRPLSTSAMLIFLTDLPKTAYTHQF